MKYLETYFTPKPKDPIWKFIDINKAVAIQKGFDEIYIKASLDKYHNTNDLPKDCIGIICDVSNNVGKECNVNPSFIILISHQYVDADQLMRQLHKNNWIAFMVNRSMYAPPPESYIDYIKDTYFNDD